MIAQGKFPLSRRSWCSASRAWAAARVQDKFGRHHGQIFWQVPELGEDAYELGIKAPLWFMSCRMNSLTVYVYHRGAKVRTCRFSRASWCACASPCLHSGGVVWPIKPPTEIADSQWYHVLPARMKEVLWFNQSMISDVMVDLFGLKFAQPISAFLSSSRCFRLLLWKGRKLLIKLNLLISTIALLAIIQDLLHIFL